MKNYDLLRMITKETHMYIKMLTMALAGLFLFVSSFSKATLITLNFNEEVIADQTKLDGSSFFSSFGVQFENSVTYTENSMFTEDSKGIYNSQNQFITILWESEITTLDFNWAVYASDILVNMYDKNDKLIGSSSFLSPAMNGTGTLSTAGIRKITWTGNANSMGIDSLTWTIPEPSTLAIFSFGLIGLASRKFKK